MNFIKYKNSILLSFSFTFGLIASIGALNYSGKSLVNVLYFLFFIVVIPFLFSLLSLIFKRAYKSSSQSGLIFSIGAFLGLIVTVTTQDLAFGWATTLNVTALEFHNFLRSIAIWKGFCSSCVPSIELIEISKISRLGSGVSSEQLSNAKMLGQWWKFLAMSLFVYGVLWRTAIYALSFLIKPKPINIEIVSSKNEPMFKEIDSSYDNKSNYSTLEQREFKLIGYNLDTTSLNIKNNQNATDTIVAVKAYEPPLLEFFDELEDITKEAKGKVSILLVGLKESAKSSDVDIWIRKIKELGLNVEVIS